MKLSCYPRRIIGVQNAIFRRVCVDFPQLVDSLGTISQVQSAVHGLRYLVKLSLETDDIPLHLKAEKLTIMHRKR